MIFRLAESFLRKFNGESDRSLVFRTSDEDVVCKEQHWIDFDPRIKGFVSSCRDGPAQIQIDYTTSECVHLVDQLLSKGKIHVPEHCVPQVTQLIITINGFIEHPSDESERDVIVGKYLVGDGKRSLSEESSRTIADLPSTSTKKFKFPSPVFQDFHEQSDVGLAIDSPTSIDLNSKSSDENAEFSSSHEDPLARIVREVIESEERPLEICDCYAPDLDDFPLTWNPKPVPANLASIKGVEPIDLPGDDPLLTGRITKAEESLPDRDISPLLHPKARLNHEERLILLKAIKMGKLPFLSLHSLSLILWKVPWLPRGDDNSSRTDPNVVLYCIFCGSEYRKRGLLLHHVQKFHTGFVATCVECKYSFLNQPAAAHHERVHEKDNLRREGNFQNICTNYKERFSYHPEGIANAYRLKAMKTRNRFTMLSEP